ncbi:MAG: hypothetical protein RRB13_09990 [bacterium]|nr:hypothetical protein [bacterium]
MVIFKENILSAIVPTKGDAPLDVDSNGVSGGVVPLQSVKLIGRGKVKVLKPTGSMKTIQPFFYFAGEVKINILGFPFCEELCSGFVSEEMDH